MKFSVLLPLGAATFSALASPRALAIEPIPESPGWRGFLQHEEPTDPVERANWLPAPKGRFYLVTRHYSPRAAILTGDWVPPPVTPP